MNNEKRWKQRFANFKRAFRLLEEAIKNIENLNMLEKEGLIQRYEYVFELALKTLKDYLENKGFNSVNSPKSAIRQAFKNEIISDGEIWMEALNIRNITVHTYDESTLNEAIKFIELFYKNLKEFYDFFEERD